MLSIFLWMNNVLTAIRRRAALLLVALLCWGVLPAVAAQQPPQEQPKKFDEYVPASQLPPAELVLPRVPHGDERRRGLVVQLLGRLGGDGMGRRGNEKGEYESDARHQPGHQFSSEEFSTEHTETQRTQRRKEIKDK